MKMVSVLVLLISILGCGGEPLQLPKVSIHTCDEVKVHLQEIGCMDFELCASVVDDAVEKYITSRLPENVPFEAFCDIALSSRLLPVDCVMQAAKPEEVVDCGKLMTPRK